ncbi:MAG TPA: AMP-binding protein [Solirubrobacteraceae bacterium]|nr:AMP-binding protein [Solirubrobacteraceae bacterium]
MKVEPWLLRAARLHPRREALRSARGSLTYDELAERALRAATTLPRDGGWIGIALPAGEDFVVALHACLLRGCVAVPVDLRLGERERALVTSRCVRVVEQPLREPARRAWSTRRPLEQTAIVVHTSGTSGPPKPVELTYGNWLWSALGAHAAMGLRGDERWLCALPLSHVGGLSILMRSAIYATTAIVHERFDADAMLAALRDDATLVSLVPTTLARLLDAGLDHPPALRCALIGGAPIPPALLERARAAGVPTMQTYGLTETCSQATTDGRPLFCTTVAVAPDGEILVTGPTVAGWAGSNRPVLRTGDLGAIDADGLLHVTGRKADTIVTGGENVAPTEVEAVLAEHPAVAQAAVHGRPDPEWGEAIVAKVVLREGAAPADGELREHCRARLAPYKVPKSFEVVDALPRTRSGKLLRRELT